MAGLLDFIGAPTGLLGSRDSSPWTDGLLPRKRIAEPAPWYMAEWIPEGIRRSAAELAAQNAVLPEALRWPRSEREIPFVPLLDLSGVPKLGETAGTTGDRAADTQSFASRWPSPPMYDPSRTSRDAGIGLNAFVPRAHANWRDAAAMFTPSAAFSQNVEYPQGDSSSHANAGANRYRHTARDVAPAQVLPDSFDVEYTQQSLTPDEASQWLNAAQNPEYFDGPDGASVAMSDRVTRIGNGGTVS